MAEVDVGAVAPEVPATPAVDTAPTDSTAEPVTTSETDDKPPAPPEKTFTQRDMDRVVAKERRRLEREADERATLRVRAELAEKRLQEVQQPPEQPKGKPQPKDFGTPEDYVEALTDWKLEQREVAQEKKSKTQREESGKHERMTAIYQAVSKGSEEFEDFREVVFGDAGDGTITEPMGVALAESKAPAKAAYYLRTHADEAQRIAALPSTLQAHEVHMLVAKLTAPPATTKAPPPITPTSGPASVEKRLEDASYEEFVKIRHKQIAAKNSRF